MSNKQPSKRNIRKAVLRRFESSVDLPRLDYNHRIKPGKGKAKITGLIFASAVYLAGFGLAYYSWNRQLIDDSFLNKISFIFMIPATVIGLFAWLISSNRQEFPIREDIRDYVVEFEGSTGTLWRYGPVIKELQLKKINSQSLIEASAENRLVEMAPEDICATIQALHQALNDPTINPTIIAEIENNFSSDNEQAA